MDQNNGLEAMIFKKETRTTIGMDLREIPQLFIRIFLKDPTSHMGTTIRTMEDHMINAQISHLIGTMGIDLEKNLSTIGMETGKTVEDFLVPHRIKGETSHKITHTANHEVIISTTLLPEDLTIDPRLVFHLTNKMLHKTKTRPHLMWFVSPQLMIPLTDCQISVR